MRRIKQLFCLCGSPNNHILLTYLSLSKEWLKESLQLCCVLFSSVRMSLAVCWGSRVVWVLFPRPCLFPEHMYIHLLNWMLVLTAIPTHNPSPTTTTHCTYSVAALLYYSMYNNVQLDTCILFHLGCATVTVFLSSMDLLISILFTIVRACFTWLLLYLHTFVT